MISNPNPRMTPKVTFENEPYLKQIEKQKYKEDLDYLVGLRRGMKEGEMTNENRYKEEFNKKKKEP